MLVVSTMAVPWQRVLVTHAIAGRITTGCSTATPTTKRHQAARMTPLPRVWHRCQCLQTTRGYQLALALHAFTKTGKSCVCNAHADVSTHKAASDSCHVTDLDLPTAHALTVIRWRACTQLGSAAERGDQCCRTLHRYMAHTTQDRAIPHHPPSHTALASGSWPAAARQQHTHPNPRSGCSGGARLRHNATHASRPYPPPAPAVAMRHSLLHLALPAATGCTSHAAAAEAPPCSPCPGSVLQLALPASCGGRCGGGWPYEFHIWVGLCAIGRGGGT